jgi:hypothetical protein
MANVADAHQDHRRDDLTAGEYACG